jgi:hypothetical protein
MTVNVAWELTSGRCVEGDISEAYKETKKVDLEHYQVRMCVKDRPEHQFQAKYLKTMSDDEIASMLKWQLGQLKSVYYGFKRL